MTITTLTSSEFNQDVGRAKKAATDGMVFITHRGRTTHVLLTIEEYRRLTGKGRSILDMLAQDGDDDFELELPRTADCSLRPAEFA